MDLIRNIFVIFSLTSVFAKVPNSGCDLITNENKCFSYFSHSGINWADARAHCQTWGGDLASIANANENAAVDSIRTFSESESCWIGLNDIGTEGTFVWSDGSNSSYRNWFSNQPDNHLGNEDCAHVHPILWNDLPCSINRICYYCSLFNANLFGRTLDDSTFEELNNNTILSQSTTLYCVTENKYTPQVTWSYVNLFGIRSFLIGATSDTTGVSLLELTNDNPGIYSCQVIRNGESVTYIAEMLSSTLNVPRSGCDLITNENKCFSYFSHSGINWADARAYCQTWGGDLASIANAGENEAVDSIRTFSESESCWIGLNDIGTEGTFVWSDGSNSSYRNWFSNQPDNHLGNEDCAHVHPILWNDLPCSINRICYYCSLFNANLFGRTLDDSTFEELNNNTILSQSTTLYCVTENKYTPQVTWSYVNLFGIRSFLIGATSDTTGVSLLELTNDNPGIYSCQVIRNGESVTYIAEMLSSTLNGCSEVKYYKVFTPSNGLTWQESQSKCVEWGGNLVSIDSSQENEYVLQNLGVSRGGDCWIGLNDIGVEAWSNGAAFTWIDGSRSIYRYFKSGEPNNAGDADCVHIWNSRHWNDLPCGDILHCYICKKIVSFFGKKDRNSFQSMSDLSVIETNSTLYCRTSATNQIEWSFKSYEIDSAISLTSKSQWFPSTGISYLNTNQFGYYSCHTVLGTCSRNYTTIFATRSKEKGCKGGKCFEAVYNPHTGLNWQEARSECMSWGGDLASIRSSDEEKFILSLGKSYYGSCWIGHHDRYNEAGNNATLFVSLEGSLSLYRNFYSALSDQYGNEDCVYLRKWNQDGWDDLSCHEKLNCYICAKPSCKDDSCFEVFTPNNAIHWENAEDNCQDWGGSLTSIRSEPEEEFLLNLIAETDANCWIGLNYPINFSPKNNPNLFEWTDASQTVYRHFHSELSDTIGREKSCVFLSKHHKSWFVSDCNNQHNCYICRRSEICSPGYIFNYHNFSCIDVNECIVSNDCDHTCTNTIGSYYCSCREHYYLFNHTSCQLIHLNIQLFGADDSSQSIHLSWDTVYRPVARLNELSYNIWVRDVTFVLDVPYTESGTTRNLDFLLNGLLPYRTYDIYVIGIDSQTANSSNIITMRTLTDRPGSPPLDISADSTNPFTIRLTWSPPNRETRNGVLTSYTIQYRRTDRRVESFNTISASLNSFDISDLDEYTSYTLRIAAATSVGVGVYSSELETRTQEGVPTASPEVRFLSKTPTTISILLQPPEIEDVNGILTNYIVTYNGNIVDIEERSIAFIALATSQTQLNPINGALIDLYEGVEYSIKARIHTSVGGGPYSSFISVTTIETAPSGPPLSVQFDGVYPNNLDFSWTPPDLELQNGVITGYLIQYHGLLVDTDERNLTIENRNSEISNLEEGSAYEISICAFTDAGMGPCLEVVYRTEEITPGQTPQNVAVEVSGSTALLVSWDHLLPEEENGIILYYLIIIEGRGFDSSVYRRHANSTATYFIVEDLQEANEYSVRLCAVNNAGNGPYSDLIIAETYEDVPSAAPQGVLGISNTNLIFILWNPPPQIERNGVITHYQVAYHGMTIDKKVHILNETFVRSAISNLQEGETYQLKVRAYTSQGPGPYSPIVLVKTLEREPTAPPRNFTIAHVSSSFIRVVWQEPLLTEQNGVIIGYDISIEVTRTHSEVSVVRIGDIVRSYTLRNLNPNSKYTMKIRAVTQPGSGPYSIPVITKTLSAR